MNEFFIPTNFEDSGKLLGILDIRNTIEAGVFSLPFIYVVFRYLPVGLTWQIIISAIFAIPVGGFALMGINDDPLTIFAASWWCWRNNRTILEYRGEVK